MLNKVFHLTENHTTVKTECIAGVTTFMTMAYILAVNPNILSAAGMDPTAVLLATCLASFLGTMCMGMMANLPFALSAGMGLNAFFAYTVVGNMGYPWQVALLAVLVEGVIFLVLSLTNVREALFNVIPISLKQAVSVGIGVYIAFIGLQNAGVVVNNDSTLVSLVSFTDHFRTSGICALLAIIGIFLTAVLYLKHVKGSILIGILGTWILGILCQLTGLYQVDAEAGYNSLIPTFAMTDFSKLGETFGQCFRVDFDGISIVNFIVVIFSFLFVDIFDTLGTLVGVCTKADMLDKDGKLAKIKPALHHHICGILRRCCCWRKNRSDRRGNRCALSCIHAVCADFHRHSVFRNGSGAGHCRLPDVHHHHRDQVQRKGLCQGNSCVPVHSGNAAVLQHLGRYLHRCDLLHPAAPDLRKRKGSKAADVHPDSSVYSEVYFPVRDCCI